MGTLVAGILNMRVADWMDACTHAEGRDAFEGVWRFAVVVVEHTVERVARLVGAAVSHIQASP
jgi:predicted amino acid racemase